MRARLVSSASIRSCISALALCPRLGVEDSNLGSRVQSPVSYR